MKSYIKNLNNIYSLIKLSKYSLLMVIVFLILDIFNLPSKYLLIYDYKLIITFGGIIFLLLVLTAVEFNFFETLKMVSINIFDGFLFVLIITLLLYGILINFFLQLYLYKVLFIVFFESIFLIIVIIRGNNLKKHIVNSDLFKSNLFDLKEIYDGNFKTNKNDIIFVNEKDVDYDLLDRSSVINQLYAAITKSKPDNRFVISLEGKWGSGKTTILNNVKKKLVENNQNILIIDEFDPWSYCDQEILFLNMFDIILKKSGYKYSVLSTKIMIENISDNIFGSKEKTKLVKGFFKQNNKINDLKQKINNYLKTTDKRVVFFIDNIDRTESENIILLFKIIGNVLNFERITYVLSFDDEQVRRVFINNFSLDYQYLKKVIQMQIRVPQFDKNLLDRLYSKCIENIIVAYGENKDDIKLYSTIINSICKNSNDIRDFKRFINSVLYRPFIKNSYLNKRDLLFIEYTRFYNYELYIEIYQNRQYFISHDKIYDEGIYSISFDKQGFNKKGKAYFDSLFSNEKNKDYKDILKEIFPYVEKYENNQNLEYDGYYISDGKYNEIAKNNRICSAKYFDLYFANTVNDFLLIGKIVRDFINKLNEISEYTENLDSFNDFINKVHFSYHIELFERLQLYLNELNEISAFNLSLVLFNNIYIINNSSRFLGLTARQRVELIIWELMQEITDENYEIFLDNIKSQYNKLESVSSILYWFEHDKEGKSDEERKQKFNLVYKEMCEKIINDSINLYDDIYYYPKNIWGLCRFYKENNFIIKNYINGVINGKNIFRIIYDVVGLSIGTKYEYSISKENLDFLTTEEEIDIILKETTPASEDQRFVLNVYNSYKNGTKDEWGETGIVTDEQKTIMP